MYGNSSKRDYYERGGGGLHGGGGGHVAVCSRGQAVALTVFVFSAIFFTALAVAFVRPFSIGPGTGGSGPNFDHCYGSRYDKSTTDRVDDDYEKEYVDADPAWTYDGEPVATNGEPFPWNNVRLPTFIKPVRSEHMHQTS